MSDPKLQPIEEKNVESVVNDHRIPTSFDPNGGVDAVPDPKLPDMEAPPGVRSSIDSASSAEASARPRQR